MDAALQYVATQVFGARHVTGVIEGRDEEGSLTIQIPGRASIPEHLRN